MTPMSDVMSLLLTFFMLTSTFVKNEPVKVNVPGSVSEIKVPENGVLTILVNPEKDAAGEPTGEGQVFMSIDNTEQLGKTLSEVMPDANALELDVFTREGTFGVPLEEMKTYLSMSTDQRHKVLPTKGIPLDSIDGGMSEFQRWVDAARTVNENIKIAATKQSDCFVRFTVIDKETADEQKVWKCRRLYDKFIAYTESVSAQRDLCYVTGEMLPVTYKHSSKIRNAGDKAKLLSSNDKDNYTYRGRFSTPAEAYAVSSIVSQKAHLALRWLIERQGTTVDTAKYVVWESHLQPILDAANPFGDNGFFDDFEDDALLPKTNIEYGKAVAKYIKGYRQKLDFSSKILLICVDAATPGRLSMVQYQEFSATDYYDNLEKWYKGVSWLARWSRNGKHCCGIITPSPYQIARFACGTERSDSGKVVADNNQLKILFRQIYSCILQGTAVPENILGSLYNRCAYPLKYSEKYGNWERLLEITCAVFRKHYIEKNGVTINVGLDRNCTDRSYLYGRLTAVADKMESDTFEGDARQTNAKRYMSAMLNAPFKTWAYLEERVLPYTAKIIKQTPQFYARYEKELGEIHSLFKMEDFASNERLDAKFFMGFYCQKQDFYKKATKETEE